jgi:hypothetical protein
VGSGFTVSCLPAALVTIASMHEGQGDLLWDAIAALMLAAGPAQERASRYGDKPALVAGSREIERLGPLLRTAMAANA